MYEIRCYDSFHSAAMHWNSGASVSRMHVSEQQSTWHLSLDAE